MDINWCLAIIWMTIDAIFAHDVFRDDFASRDTTKLSIYTYLQPHNSEVTNLLYY